MNNMNNTNNMNNMNPMGQPGGQRALLSRAVALGSSNLFLFAILTVVNMVLTVAKADISFSFSAEIPPILFAYGVSAAAEAGAAVAAVFFVLGLIAVGFIFLCAALSKKKPGWLIAGLVYTVIDLLLAMGFYIPPTLAGLVSPMSLIFSLAFHIWMIYYLVKGISAASKLKKLPPEPMMYDVPFTAAQPSAQPFEGAQNQSFTDGAQSGYYPPEGQPAQTNDAGNADNTAAPADNANTENGENREQ